MTNFARFSIAAAAVVVAALVGLRLLPGQGSSGTQPPATIASTPTPTSTPGVSGQPVALPSSGPVAAGTYYAEEGAPAGPKIRVTFTVPDGWATEEDSFMYKDKGQPGEVMFVTWTVSHIYTDACNWDNGSLVEIGPTPDDLIKSLAHGQKSRAETAGGWPWTGTIGGFPAEGVELEVPADLDTSTCTGGNLRYWPDPGPDFTGGLCCNPPGNRDFIYAVDVNGQTIALIARRYAGSTAENVAELDAILKSIKLELE